MEQQLYCWKYNSDKNKILSVEEYLNKIRIYLKDNHKWSQEIWYTEHPINNSKQLYMF